jgi:4-oxalocrotonate tautomerase
MPHVVVRMLEGRTEEQKRALVEKVTAAISETANAPKERVTVYIEEMAKSNYAEAGVLISDK